MSPSVARLLARLDRWPRRLAALTCVVLAAASAIAAHRPQPARARDRPAEIRIVVAAHDLGAAHTLTTHDLTTAAWPSGVVPAGAAARPAQLVGRRVAGPIGTGEAVTSARLVGTGLTAGLPPGQVAVSLFTDAGVATLVHPGDRVDVVAGPPDDAGTAAATIRPRAGPGSDPGSEPDSGSAPGDAALVAEAAVVLAVLPTSAASGNTDAQLVVATDRGTAVRIVAVQARQTLAVVVDPP